MKPRQKKSRFYYYFRGLCAVAVCTGQRYVGTGYRKMADTLNSVIEAPLIIEVPNTSPLYR